MGLFADLYTIAVRDCLNRDKILIHKAGMTLPAPVRQGFAMTKHTTALAGALRRGLVRKLAQILDLVADPACFFADFSGLNRILVAVDAHVVTREGKLARFHIPVAVSTLQIVLGHVTVMAEGKVILLLITTGKHARHQEQHRDL